MLPSDWTVSITDTDDTTNLDLPYEKDADNIDIALYTRSATIDDPTLPPDYFQLRRVKPKASADFYGTRRFFGTIRSEYVIPQPTGDRLTPIITYINGTRPLGFPAELVAQHDKLCRAILAHANWEKFTVRGEI